MESVKERLIQFIEYKGISKYEFEKRCVLSPRYVSNIKNSIQPDKMERIAIAFPELNFDWLLIGRGSMLLNENGVVSMNQDNKDIKLLEDQIESLKEINSLLREKISRIEAQKKYDAVDRELPVAAEEITYNKNGE